MLAYVWVKVRATLSEDFKIKAMMLRNMTDGEARMRLLGTMAGNSR